MRQDKKKNKSKQTKNKKQCTKVRTTEKIKQEKTIKTGLLRVNFLFSSFCHSSSNSVMFGHLSIFIKILIYISCYPWSEVCMIMVAFLPNSFAYFLRARLYSFELPITPTVFAFPTEKVRVIGSRLYCTARTYKKRCSYYTPTSPKRPPPYNSLFLWSLRNSHCGEFQQYQKSRNLPLVDGRLNWSKCSQKSS